MADPRGCARQSVELLPLYLGRKYYRSGSLIGVGSVAVDVARELAHPLTTTASAINGGKDLM